MKKYRKVKTSTRHKKGPWKLTPKRIKAQIIKRVEKTWEDPPCPI